MGVTVVERFLPGQQRGRYVHSKKSIVLNTRLHARQKAHTFGHELGHAHYGHEHDEKPGSVAGLRQERKADEFAARLLINSYDYEVTERMYALSDGIVTDDELATFRQAAHAFELEPAAVTHIESQLLREQMLGEIRQGRLPTVQIPGLHLPTDEYCYMVAGATRWRDLQAGPTPSQGQLAITNRKIRFIAQQHGGEIPLSKVQRVSYLDRTTVLIESTARSLSGRFSVPDAEYTSILVDTALRIDRRILLPNNADRPSRHIPAHVKSAVFQRDRGACVECGANSYLEYDHIIPFSRGGASTEGNVQLLCRACNLAKGARV